MEKRTYDRRIWLGAGILLIGLLVLLDNLGIGHYRLDEYLFRWEVLLIVLGTFFILSDRNRSTGIILIIIGGVFYLRDLFNLSFNFWELFFPGMLILIGVMIILRHYIDRDPVGGDTLIKDENVLDELAIFGGGDRVITSKQFQGGKVTTVFGGLNYDMMQASLAPGKNYIDVFCIFGGMKIIAPEDWDIKIRVFSIFGGFGEKQRYLKPRTGITEPASQLIIKGTVIFGGGEIKRYHD